jgi:hypothetical protein
LFFHVGGGFFEFAHRLAQGSGHVWQSFAAEKEKTYNEDEHHLHAAYALEEG